MIQPRWDILVKLCAISESRHFFSLHDRTPHGNKPALFPFITKLCKTLSSDKSRIVSSSSHPKILLSQFKFLPLSPLGILNFT